MNGVDVAQNRATLPQSFFYEPPRRDDEQQQPAPAPPQQQTTPQQPAFTAGYDAHAQDQPQSNPEGDGDDSGAYPCSSGSPNLIVNPSFRVFQMINSVFKLSMQTALPNDR